MTQRFQSRTALMDEHIESFLKIVTELGGYCTLEQAKALELAHSHTRVLAYLRGLERVGFVRRVADHSRAQGVDGRAAWRRSHHEMAEHRACRQSPVSA